MIRNYFMIAFRQLKANLLYSFINIMGLSIGIASCLLLALFVLDEWSFDRYNKNAEHIFRVVCKQTEGNDSRNVATTQGLLAPELGKSFAEVEAVTRAKPLLKTVLVEGKDALEGKILAVDSSYLSIFTLPLKYGEADRALNSQGVLISESEALRLFGKSDPMGQIISIVDVGEMKVTGVFFDFPNQSHLRADYLIAFSWIEKTEPQSLAWDSHAYYTYVLLTPKTALASFNAKLDEFVHRFTPETWKDYRYFLQPLTAIHMDESFHFNAMPAIGHKMINAFIITGGILLALACFNYMNMATARSVRRSLEVGVRKVMGAYRMQLVGQFLAESVVLCVASFALAILWADLALPFFNSFMSMPTLFGVRTLKMSIFFTDYTLLASLVGGVALLSIVAGSYPAFFLSKYRPALVLKSRFIADTSRRFRRSLVLVQFALTTLLLIMAVVVAQQTDYMQHKDLGFNKEQLLIFSASRNKDLSLPVFKAELERIPGVLGLTAASSFPGRSTGTSEIRPSHASREESIEGGSMLIDQDYLPTMQIPLLAGRNFLADGTDEGRSVLINEKAAMAMGYTPVEKAIGKSLSGFIFSDTLQAEIIGVIKDFHASSLRREIAPMVFGFSSEGNRYLVRMDATSVQVKEQVDATVKRLIPGIPIESSWMNDFMDKVYMPENKTAELLATFTVLAIIIGCMGLYALSAYEGERRMKELGIRKVMGASSFQLLRLLSRSFMKLVVVAMVVAMPVAYFLAKVYLRSIPYHITLSKGLFVKATLAILVLAWITIAAQALRASRLNPVDTLRHE